MNPIILRTLRGEPVTRPGVWLMRQAGRYLTEYQEMKARHTFLELCTSPDLAVEVTMQPMRIFRPDAAILFSDILIPAQCLGIHVDFSPGPVIHNPLVPAGVEALKIRTPQECVPYVFETVRRLRAELEDFAGSGERPALLGFAGAPWTMACYILEQRPYKHFHGTQVHAAESPAEVTQLLSLLASLTAEYLIEQIRSGADAVQLFDSWAGNLSIEDYRRWALPPTREIVRRVQAAGAPIILYVNGSAHLLEAMKEAGADGYSVDWRTSIKDAENVAGKSCTIQGNFDPAHLFGSREAVVGETRAMLSTVGHRGRYIANLGHGVLQRTPRENVQAFIETVQAGYPA